MKTHRWQHWVIAALGLWMLISHLVLRSTGIHSDALWNAWLVGRRSYWYRQAAS